MRRCRLPILLTSLALIAGSALGGEKFIIVASTTSTENSGLFDHILPLFEARTGIDVRVVAKGTGQAILIARAGDADLLLVHHKPSELKFVDEGYGIERREVMYNDFVLVGPRDDPAGIAETHGAAAALAKIARAKAIFVSRGDHSGTNLAELEIWNRAETDPRSASGTWYRETGSGMGATLNTAAAMDAYTLSDRGTWIGFKNKRDLTILLQGDPMLFNQYSVILVNPERFPHVKSEAARAFVDWLTSPEGKRAIASFKLEGQQLFFPNGN